ncbi:MFS transporter [Paenibacillus alvei]
MANLNYKQDDTASAVLQKNPLDRKWNHYLLISIVFGGFLIFGFSENIKGPAIPLIQQDFRASQTQIGLLLALNSFGYLLACSYTSWMSDRIGVKWTGISAFLLMTFSGVFIYLSASFPSLSAAFFVLYLGNGMLEIALGIMAARIFTKNTGTMLNISHFFYGLSSTVAPIFAASVMDWHWGEGDVGWRGMYFLFLALSLLPILPSLFSKFPAESKSDGDGASFKSLIKDRVAWLIVAVLSLGVVSEMAVGGWLINFLVQAYSWDIKEASNMLSLFFLFFMFARLLLGPVTDKIGFARSIMYFSAFSGICTIAGILIGEKGAIFFCISGIGIALVYPTIMALLAKRYPIGTGAAITFTVTLMGIASVIGNFLIGFIIDTARIAANSLGAANSEIIGLKFGYGFIGLLALLCSVCCYFLYRSTEKNKEII